METGTAPARLSLRNGSIVRLSGGAKATIHENLVLLERGIGQLETSSDYAIRARSVTVVPKAHPARARLQVSDDGALQLAALSGVFEVRRAGTSAIVSAGKSLRIAANLADAGAVAPAEYKGCLAKSEKGYLLQDDSTKTIIALKSDSIGAKPGDRVNVTGKLDTAATPVGGATQVVQVLRLTVSGHGCSTKAVLAAAAGAGAGAAAATAATGTAAAAAGAGGATAAGISATTVTVIGVAAASAAIIPTVALTTGSDSPTSSISPSSR